jgi:sulfate adenylyltransferase
MEAHAVYAGADTAHPGVDYLLNHTHPIYVGGRVRGLVLPEHFDYPELRHTARQLRACFAELGWQRVVAFHTRTPMHRPHIELCLAAARDADANVLIHPAVGLTTAGDIDHFTRIRCYQHVLRRFPEPAALSLLPLSMRMAGPREAAWQAIIHKNYGCTHFVVARGHAELETDRRGGDGYPHHAAQALLAAHAKELGIEPMFFGDMVYVENRATYLPADQASHNDKVVSISGTELRRRLSKGVEIPAWFSYPEVLQELRNSYPPNTKRGVTVFFTGLSGAGKSTIAKALLARLMQMGERSVTLLDGDVVRKMLSSELGFSREHRDLNVLRIGFVAAEITKHGGIALCTPIAPYRAMRNAVRKMIEPHGAFIEVHVSTPLEVCEGRDRKGLYAKARAGLVKQFTGISDPYEEPLGPEVVIDTRDYSVAEEAEIVLERLVQEGYLSRSEPRGTAVQLRFFNAA